jgi:glycosyltransferase involved in cell wall biosynthesis
MSPKRHVHFYQQRLVHYRESFLQQSKELLSQRNIELSFIHCAPDAESLKKKDSGYLSWSQEVVPLTLNIGGTKGIWLPAPHAIAAPDLVIVTQENKLLANYAWLLRRQFGGPKVAFWGHGRNFQTNAPSGMREKWKRTWIGRVDWWFGYTQITRGILLDVHYPDERISVLDNAIDNESFKTDLKSITDTELDALRQQLGVQPNVPMGLFCGSLYPDKRVDFMIKAVDKIRESVPNFSMVVIGDGSSAGEVRDAISSRPWLHWVGVKKGRKKAAYFKLASVVINPGAVGLHVLDSFISGVPMATTADARHGPEVVYLEHGVNGINVEGGCNEYAAAVVQLFLDKEYLVRMREASALSAEKYTLKNMVENFVVGIDRCLASPKK